MNRRRCKRGKPNADVRDRDSEISDFKSPPCDYPKAENLKLKTSGEAKTIGTTSNHPFWSEDRQEFVQAGSLEIGERLQTLSGDVKVVQKKLPRPGPQPVFNLEVHDEHVYFVGEDGVLVHNSGNGVYLVPDVIKPNGVEFEGTVWRYEYPSRRSTTWTQHAGNVAADHRYTKPGVGGVYGGLTKATARQEIAAYPGALTGRVATQKTVRLSNVLDLRDVSVQRRLGVTIDDLTQTSGNKYAVTQVIGNWAKSNGYSGLIAPSAGFRGRANLISFEDL